MRRYKRFLADVRLADGTVTTAHCPNSGSLLGCREEGLEVHLLDSCNDARRCRYTWVLVRVGRTLVAVDTGIANRVVHEAVTAGEIPELTGYARARREVPYGRRSRVDLLLEGRAGDTRPCYVEVKSTTLADGRVAMFPDAVTERGLKHLRELQRMVRRGARAVNLFFLNRGDTRTFRPADAIDREYGRELRRAARNGVELLAVQARITPRGVTAGRAVQVDLA